MAARNQVAPSTQDAAAFTLRSSTPYAVLDAVDQCVLEALEFHGAMRTQLLGGFDTKTVGREELFRGGATAVGREHPLVFLGSLVHGHLLSKTSRRGCGGL